MTQSIPVQQNRRGHGDFGREKRRQPGAEVPTLDWPADLFTGDAATVDIMAEECWFRYDSPAMWYGNHIPPMHA
jgi:hypothetical protein